MAGNTNTISREAWIVIDDISNKTVSNTLNLNGRIHLYEAMAEGGWLLVLNSTHEVICIGRILRIRSDLENTILYLDRQLVINPTIHIAATGLTAPAAGNVQHLAWDDFFNVLSGTFKKTVDDIP